MARVVRAECQPWAGQQRCYRPAPRQVQGVRGLRRRVDSDSGFCFRWYVTNPEQRQPSPFGEEVVLDNCVGKLPRRELALYFYILFFACSMDRLAAGTKNAAETRRDPWTRVRAGVAP